MRITDKAKVPEVSGVQEEVPQVQEGAGGQQAEQEQSKEMQQEMPKEMGQLRDHDQIEGTSSIGTSIFNLANSILGSGILGLSYALANTGILFFFSYGPGHLSSARTVMWSLIISLLLTNRFLFILVSLLTSYSIHLMLVCSEATGCLNYEKIGEKTFGFKGKYTVFGTTFLQTLGGILTYLFIIKNELPCVMKVLMGKEEAFTAWYVDDRILVVLVTTIIVFPLCLMKHLGFLGYTSGLSLSCMVFFLFVIIYEKFQIQCPLPGFNSSNVPKEELQKMCKPRYILFNFKTVYALPTIAFAYVCHQAVLPVYSNLRNRSLKKMEIVSNVSIFSICVMYLFTAFFGYLTFYGEVHSSLLHTYTDKGLLLLIVRLSVMMAVTLTIPVLFLTARDSLAELLKKPAFNLIERIVIAAIILGFVDTLVLFVPTMKDLFGVLGTTTSNVLIFILPTTMFLKITKDDPEKENQRFGVSLLLGLGILFSLISIPLVIYDWISSTSIPETN